MPIWAMELETKSLRNKLNPQTPDGVLGVRYRKILQVQHRVTIRVFYGRRKVKT